MSEKSHVSLEQQVCQVCGATFDTGAILLDKRLRSSMERHTTTGWGLCPEHQKLFDAGYVAIIEIDPKKTNLPAGQGAVGQLQASQTTNQLLALQARQSMQEQQLRIAQDRATAAEQARQLAAEVRGQEVQRRFMGNGTRYTPVAVSFYNR